MPPPDYPPTGAPTEWHHQDKPEWYQGFLILWILYALAVSVLCLRMIFHMGNDSWRQLSHRNGILWGLVVYLLMRALFYVLYLADDEHSMGTFIYYSLIDVPTMIFYFVYTQLVLYWATMVDKNALEEHRWRNGYFCLMGCLLVILITNLVYRLEDGADTMRYVYGLTLGVMTIGLALGFVVYGWKFQTKFETLPEGDVRRRRLPRMLTAMIAFSVGFVIYGFFLVCGYAFGLDYMPGYSGLSHSQEGAVVFRMMDCLLASLIIYIVKAPGNNAAWKKTFAEPLLETDQTNFSEMFPGASVAEAFTSPRGTLGKSLGGTPMHSMSSPVHSQSMSESMSGPHSEGAKDRSAQERFLGYDQPMGAQTQENDVPTGKMTMTDAGGGDFPYKDRVMKHYRQQYGQQGAYTPPSNESTPELQARSKSALSTQTV